MDNWKNNEIHIYQGKFISEKGTNTQMLKIFLRKADNNKYTIENTYKSKAIIKRSMCFPI